MRQEDELVDLLAQRPILTQLNSGMRAQSSEEVMPPDVASWFGLAGVCLAEKWNNRQYTVLGNDLLSCVISKGAGGIKPDQWKKAILTFCSPNRKPGKVFHFLLITSTPDKFIVNQPEIERFWSSDLIQAFLVLYGGPPTVRAPSSDHEKEWCDWMRSVGQTAK